MPEGNNKFFNAAKNRVATIRLRTWSLTLVIVIALILYLIVNVTTKQQINWIDFLFLCTVQIVAYCLYFPDGELYGQKDSAFINNKTVYNEKASEINKNKDIARLREYCKFEYQERRKRFLENALGELGITEEEFETLKQKTEKEIRHLKAFEFEDEIGNSRLIFFSKHKRKVLFNLLFKPLPVEENHPETIMSAVENNGNRAIRDNSVSYKLYSYVRKGFMAVVVGGVLAYVGYTTKDGFGWNEIVSICMYLTTLLTTAVMAFSSGEVCSKVHKSRFYLDLINFIEAFNEWNLKNNNKKED
jgi:hypothetical protein